MNPLLFSRHSHTGKNTRVITVFTAVILLFLFTRTAGAAPSVRIPDTGQTTCYDAFRQLTTCPGSTSPFFGQDAQYSGYPLSYQDNGDGTVTDLTTGLMWSRAVDARKISLQEARSMAAELTLAGHSDWRVPTIKELYSLMNFAGRTPMGNPGRGSSGSSAAIPYINTDYFNFKYGSAKAGERSIDAQWLSATEYVYTTMNGARTLFGVNFADGRIKGYGYGANPRREKKFYVRFVRGGPYGHNDFRANTDGTVTDRATGLTWAAADSGRTMTWEEALAYARASTLGGYTDWRLPNAKELQYIVDYTRSPDTTGSAAIDPLFSATPVTNEAGAKDFGHYWTSTTHLDGPRPDSAVTICFGRAMGKMHGQVMDVHGAGAQRSDPKSGGNSIGRGPQGDARHGRNFVRLVRGGQALLTPQPPPEDPSAYPNVVRVDPGYEAAQGGSVNSFGGGSRMGGAMGGPGSMQDGYQQQMGPEGMNRGFDGSPSFQGGGQTGEAGTRFVQRLDRDGDGKVSRTEFDGPPDHFSRFDRNADGFISREEAPSGPPPGRMQGGGTGMN